MKPEEAKTIFNDHVYFGKYLVLPQVQCVRCLAIFEPIVTICGTATKVTWKEHHSSMCPTELVKLLK